MSILKKKKAGKKSSKKISLKKALDEFHEAGRHAVSTALFKAHARKGKKGLAAIHKHAQKYIRALIT